MLDELKELTILAIPGHIPGAPFRSSGSDAGDGPRWSEDRCQRPGGRRTLCGYPGTFLLAMKKLRNRDPEGGEAGSAPRRASPIRSCGAADDAALFYPGRSSVVTLNDGGGACEALGLTRGVRRPNCGGRRFFAADLEDWDLLRRHGLTGRSLRYLLHYDHRLARHFGVEGRAPLLSRSVVDLVPAPG